MSVKKKKCKPAHLTTKGQGYVFPQSVKNYLKTDLLFDVFK